MFTWMKKIGEEKPDHPMYDEEAARKLLDDLPQHDPLAALDEINSWLTSIKNTRGFHPERRAAVIYLLDETGQPLQKELLQQFVTVPRLHDERGMHMWQVIYNFTQALHEAYADSFDEYRKINEHPQEETDSVHLKEQLHILCVRLMHATAEQIRLQLLRYHKVEDALWKQLYEYYSFAEARHFADTMMQAYPLPAMITSPQRELLRALVLKISATTTLSQAQIEACYRIITRLAGLFTLRNEPSPDCPYFIDLAQAKAPEYVDETLPDSSTMRFLGAVNALGKLEAMINLVEHGLTDHGHDMHEDDAPGGKLTLLKHLAVYWDKKKRYRQQERQKTNITIEIAHGFDVISKLVKSFELGKLSNLSDEDAAMLKQKSDTALIKEGVHFSPEILPAQNISSIGIGCLIPKTAGDWFTIGSLCSIRTTDNPMWAVGMIRRIQIKKPDEICAGFRIFAQRPLSLWLRTPNKSTTYPVNQTSSTGSAYNYLPIILLPDSQNLFVHATLLMKSGNYVADSIYEMMMGQKNCNIKLIGLLEEGEDYEHVSFQWL